MNSLLFILAVCVMTIMGSLGALFFKRTIESSGVKNIFGLLQNRNFYVGTGLYAIGMLINIVLLQYYDFTLVYPLSSLTYIWTLLISAIILKEKIGTSKIIGVILIIFGASLIGFVG